MQDIFDLFDEIFQDEQKSRKNTEKDVRKTKVHVKDIEDWRNDNMRFGETLRKLRVGQCLSGQELADMLGTTPTMVYKYETDRNANPSLKVLKNIADILDVTVGELIDGEIGADMKEQYPDGNLMPKVAELLGLKLGEEFGVEGESFKYRLTKDGAEYKTWDISGEKSLCNNSLLNALLTGKKKITKEPWKPIEGETYWSYSNMQLGKGWRVKWFKNRGTVDDSLRAKANIMYPTREKALKDLPNAYKRLTGKEWEDKPHKPHKVV